ncbi:hypothetical protein [Bacillus dakarensis]|uniref:hypothetical protein n=1 Tax=Robertmurraya dakarensis TaxID=1926278 RepID=UPI00098196AF|nr:hypothetical protein [Bacillus dakarensis]
MEKQINDLETLTQYQNRQVVLNYYEEDCLYDRQGFNFKRIMVTRDNLTFIKHDGSPEQKILLKEYPEKYIKDDFRNYYTIKNGENRIDIYFP